MWSMMLGAGQWLAGTKVGRITLAVLGAIAGALFLRGKWRGDGAREEQAKQAVEAAKIMERVDEAGAQYRGDGAARRMRDGTF